MLTHILWHIFQSRLTANCWLLFFGIFLGHFHISLRQTHTQHSNE